ncbi:hypothetical protein CHU_0222 [Cytophaga hutchinsonii ATCC 33406]|uniref:Uncharacterized protein n=1 Tax=Cytophaga hutchinsonii (strain ATCC 33406 / DSM 1761 / CIP 103989 / NBRC 15051 / NCIMB 9469 / D465) TaxID=269798 RepID=A0A6N4SMM1_CYTH3|nr:hypothetical protein CHU_0222 [Cytophaga hutchinsonii ATCC 33406]
MYFFHNTVNASNIINIWLKQNIESVKAEAQNYFTAAWGAQCIGQFVFYVLKQFLFQQRNARCIYIMKSRLVLYTGTFLKVTSENYVTLMNAHSICNT